MNDKEIKIDNLTPAQIEMLDIMWSFETYSEYQEWIDSMSQEEAAMAERLQRLIILEVSDRAVEDELDTAVARNYLKKFQLT